MRRDPLERLTIRAALVLGFGLVLGLWGFTGYSLSGRMAEMEQQTSDVTRRYMRAQDLLSAIRSQVNVSSILLRDALLDPAPGKQARYRERLEENYESIGAALDTYHSVLDASAEPHQLARLRGEIAAYRRVTLEVLDAYQANNGTSAADLLGQHITPRRSAAIALSDELRTLNRGVFVEHQIATASIHRETEQQWWIGLGAALAANLAIALVAILYAGRLEDRLRKGRARDAEHAHELRRLSARLVDAQEEERRNIARELHDEVGQVLSAIKVELQLAERTLASPVDAGRSIAELQDLADGALHTVRDLSQLLRPTILDDLGLAAAIDWLLRGLERRHGVRVDLQHRGLDVRLSADLEVTAFRIVQEALANVARHARAGQCSVSLTRDWATLIVVVEDDGVGFQHAAPGAFGGRRGLGLVGIRERAAERQGTLVIDSAPQRGTRLVVTLPLERPGGRETGIPPVVSHATALHDPKGVHG